MSIQLPSALTVSGVVVDTSSAPVSSFRVHAKLISPDGSSISTVSSGGTPIEVITGSDGSFSLTMNDSTAITQLITQGFALLFKSGADDTPATQDAGLSRTTPLYLNSRQSVRVVIEWQPQQVGTGNKPAIASQLRIRTVSRDGQLQPAPLAIVGQVEGPQGLPVAGLQIRASLVVPGTGQTVRFPQPEERPVWVPTAQNGSFRLTLSHAGDLLPFQPYSAYGLQFSAQNRISPSSAPTGVVTSTALCHVNPAEATQVKLRWDASDPANPQLRVECIHRNGVACKPDEGTLQALGQLVDDASSQPLIGHRVQVQAGATNTPMGEVRTNAQGYFSLSHPWSLALAAQDVSMQWTLQIFDPTGKQLATNVPLTQNGLVDTAVVVRVSAPRAQDLSPTLAQMLTAIAKTIDTKTQAALDAAKIKSLQDILNYGGLNGIKGTVAADKATLTQIEQAADLWSLLPATVTAASAATYIATWQSNGILGSTDLGNLPRAKGTRALKAQLGDFAAAQTHAVAVARTNLLNFLLLGARIDEARNAAGGGMSARTHASQGIARASLPADTQQSCSCEDCQTAVSPNAYLMDLIRYAYYRVQNNGAAISVEDLQSFFFQPFADLPTSCDAMTKPVLTTRLAIEILRSYGAPMTLPSDLAAALASNVAAYRQQAYDALLSQLGTSETELRLALGHADQLSALADRLSLPSATEVQSLLVSSTALTDSLLESLFGLRDYTRAALDNSQPSPQLLGWRMQRLQTAWATQDAPTVFPSGVPILDPDVLDFSNLRQGWDSTNASTVLWTARRTAIDAQLATRANGRAMAIGAAAMAVTQPGVTTPSSDQKRAAYLTVSLSDEEIQSQAALLPLDQQDQAKLEAAKHRVLTSSLTRTAIGSLSSDELTTIAAIVNYTGTTLTQQAQAATRAWLELQFTSLVPTSGGALPMGDWADIQAALKGAHSSRTIDQANQDLARFNFPVDAFLRAIDLWLKLVNQDFHALLDADWAEFDAIFVALWKIGQVASWLTDEQNHSIGVTAGLFWQSATQPAQRKWLGSDTRYQEWLAALQSALSDPIINPALIGPGAFVDTGSTAFGLWTTRATWLTSTATALQTARSNVDGAMTGKLAVFDAQVLAAFLLIPSTGSPAQLWYEPDQLQAAYDQGSMTAAHLSQLMLDRNGFQAIFALRSLYRDAKTATDQEWTPAELALAKAQLRQQYGTWRAQEAASSLSLSPVFFQLPAPPLLSFPPQPSTNNPTTSLFTQADLEQWQGVLRNRIAQQQSVTQDQADLIDQVEQAVLGNLRDALQVYGIAAGFDGNNITEILSDRFLFDFADSPTNKTTRVGQAIATLQLLLFGLRSGNLFRLANGNTANYPNLTLEAEYSDAEWQWIGTYGSWRSALFIFMYPENLLYPTLRDRTEQSQSFQDLVQTLRSGGPTTPATALTLGQQYNSYFQSLLSLKVQASCLVTVPGPDATQGASPATSSTQGLCLMFAASTTGGGPAAWSSRALDASISAKQSPWNPIPGWTNVKQIVGAVPWYSKAGKHRVSVVAWIFDEKGNQKLQVQNLDLTQLGQGADAWGSGASDLSDLPAFSPAYRPSVVIEQVSLFDPGAGVVKRPPQIYVGMPQPPGEFSSIQLKVYRRPLNDDGSGWDGSQWSDYFCDTAQNCSSLLAGFAVDIGLADPIFPSYQFIAQDASSYALPGYGKLFNFFFTGTGIDLNTSYSLGALTGLVVLGANTYSTTQYVLVLGTAGSQLFWYYGNGEPWVFNQPLTVFGAGFFTAPAPYIAPQSAEIQWTQSGSFNSVISPPVIGSLPDSITNTGFRDSFMTLDVDLGGNVMFQNRFAQVILTPTVGDIGRPLGPTDPSQPLKDQSYNAWMANLGSPAMLLQLYEAYFALPMHLATQLQQAGFYQDALDWYRTVYDHTLHAQAIDPQEGDLRKVYYGLVAEESEPADGYLRTQAWFADPFNPHAVAALRQNAYTRFTLLTIIGCLLDYADSDFAADTAESVPQARTLYLEALQWAGAPELAAPPDCPTVVAKMDFSFVPSDWLGATQQLQASLVSALGQLSPAAGSQLQSDVTAALKDTATPQWGARFAHASAAIRAAVAAAPKPPRATAAFKADRTSRQAAHRALLAMPAVQQADALLRQHAGGRFRDTLSALTGVAGSTLTSDPTLQLTWLSQSVRTRGTTRDPAHRSPVLVQPATAVSATFLQRWRWDPLRPTSTGLAGQELLAAPAQALAAVSAPALQFLPTSLVSFCIPPNPTINALKLRGELNLYKLRSGRNITGVQRQLDFYAAPTDAQTGLPTLSANGGLSIPNTSAQGPTQYRYSVLLSKAQQQVAVAAQFESQLLQALEQADNQQENLLRARNDLATQQATLNLKNLEIQEAQLGVSLVQVQQERNQQVQSYYSNLLSQGLSDLEQAALGALGATVILQTAAAYTNTIAAAAFVAANGNPFEAGVAGAQAIGSIATAISGFASVSSTLSQIYSMQASFQRRQQDWQQQQTLAGIDGKALNIQFQQANLSVQIKQQDANITSLQIQNAQSVVDFLVTKFTNAELFEWMSRVLQGLYSGQLQQATATARLAQQQLSFDLLQSIDLIRPDYWTVPVDNAAPSGPLSTGANTSTTDRKGLTGAERLQSDIQQMDGIAQQQTTRKLQLSRTISLATQYPGDFQRLKETGEMWFATTEQDFDQEFPGHYFRRIRQVKVSVLALVPAVRGIRATLSNIGPSRVTVPGTVGFAAQTLPPSNDSVSYTAPQNATGLFDLDIQPDLNLPFEGVGVDTLWHFELPMPANLMDFTTIADVQVTILYTALYSADYRAQLLADPAKLPTSSTGVRVFSFRNELADLWYDLHNPPPAPFDLRATFAVDATDFPSGVSNIRASRLTLYLPIAPDADGTPVDLSKDDISKQIGIAFGDNAAPAVQALNSSSLISAQSAADPWFRQLPAKTLSPFGSWTLVLPASQAILDLLRADQIQDILFAITYEADLPPWPSGQRPKGALF